MPRIVREADVTWEGSSARGSGTMAGASSRAFSLPCTEVTRVAQPDGHSSPEELLAAAHAGCFAMSLASQLTKARTPPARLEVRAAITMDEIEGKGHQIVSSDITVRGVVPGATAEGFVAAVAAADEGCPFSALLRASAEVSVTANYEYEGET